MRALFIGGTGIISTACTRLAARNGVELTLLNRGQRASSLPDGVEAVSADMDNPDAVASVLAGRSFDVVVDWIAYTPAHVERDLKLFRGRTRQYIFISSASAYQKPSTHYRITESTPLANPYWQYSRDKIACEERLMKAYREEGFPVTIVRPSLTYGDTLIPLAVNSWPKSYTVVDRMLRGRKVIVPGDGTSLWVITHNSDFARGFCGLMGHAQALGHAFHITSDEVLTWDQYYGIVGAAIGVEPKIVHISSDFIGACVPEMRDGLVGDKSVSVVFDNSKIRSFVPGYCATTTFAEGIRRSLAWFDADPMRKQIDEQHNADCDRIIDAYENGLKNALRSFGA